MILRLRFEKDLRRSRSGSPRNLPDAVSRLIRQAITTLQPPLRPTRDDPSALLSAILVPLAVAHGVGQPSNGAVLARGRKAQGCDRRAGESTVKSWL